MLTGLVLGVALLAAAAAHAQPPGPGAPDDQQEQRIQLTPPGSERIFGKLESEASLQERMRQEARERPSPERIEFPKENLYLTKEPFKARQFPALTEVVEPYYVTHRRLYFQQINLERGGWDLGFMTPAVSLTKFWWDFAWMPYRAGTDLCRRYENSAGQCLPGDPVPLLLYPPQFSVSGVVFEATTIVSLFAIFPG